jgi:hypothetical protein
MDSTLSFNTISTLSGNVNLRKASAKVCIFHCPRAGSVGNMEVFLDKAATSGVTAAVVRRSGMPHFISAVPGVVPEIGGRMINQSFSIAEGEILKVFVNVRPGWGKLPKTGAVFVRIRAKAALRKLEFPMIKHADVAYQESLVEGRFDVLTLADALALGIKVPNHLRMFCEDHCVAQLGVKQTVIDAEISAAVQFEQKQIGDGDTVKTIVVRKRRRSIE